ncbi:MAG: S8 family serine peptidase [Phycisphaerales bacterium]|nr:S8 family serine peptidase [Phycisphaerales bacterium]
MLTRATSWVGRCLVLTTVMLAGLLILPAAAAQSADEARTEGLIRWRSGAVATQPQDQAALTQLVDTARQTGGHVVVQLERALTDALRDQLDAAGVRLLSYLGDNAFFAAIDPARASGAAVASVPDIRCVLPIERDWKLHPDFVADRFLDYAIVSRDESGEVAYPLWTAAYILFHSDIDTAAEGAWLVEQYGGRVRSSLAGIHGLVIELPADAIKILAMEDAVQWIEPPLPGLVELNNSNRDRVGANTVQAPPYGLSGAGVKVLVYDGGKIRASHQDLSPRVVIGPADNSGTSDHATHVAGTIGGTGTASSGNFKGMAPGVTFISFGFEQPGGLQQGFLYTDPGDLYKDYHWAISNGAHISNNSIGTNTAPNGFPCEWEGNYGVTDVLIDTIVRGDGSDPNFASPFRVVWANGNERQTSRCGSTYNTTAPPACAKNHITVGALNSNDDSVTSFTSWGPADDNRMKPDVSAPGCQSNDDLGVTSCGSASDTAYTAKCGTSMACPTTCGVAALILQDFRQHYPGQPDFRNSTLKAILAHTAQDIETPGPDYKTGYGSIRAQPAVDLVRSGNFYEGVINSTGQTVNLYVLVGAGQGPIKVTLAWDDKPGTPNVNPVLVNDLDLRLYDAQGNSYFPWTLGGLANPGLPAIRLLPNRVDNIEQVLIDAPTPGAYRIEVRGFNVPQGPQPFSLTATPQLVQCSSAGIASLDRVKYACTSTATLRVVDCDLNTSNQVVDTVIVNLASNTTPAGVDVVLTEVAPEAANFVGTIDLRTSAIGGALQVSPGDLLTLTYFDADDGTGQSAYVTVTAAVDCAPPVATGVGVNPLGTRTATVVFSTDEPAQATLRYGRTCNAFTSTVASPTFRTSHAFPLTGLSDNTTYFYVLELVDEAGNTSVFNNGGSCYGFTTLQIPDFFTELFDPNSAATSNDLDYLSLTWTPTTNVSRYRLCRETITALPTDPTGHASLGFTAGSQFKTIQLAGGATVKLYGQSYGTIYVGGNGYLTFLAGDTDNTESLADHFAVPRISALFDALQPQPPASATWAQLPDRVVITFRNVREPGGLGNNTFQYELFFDGVIKIHYLGLTARGGLAGLSAGGGLSEDYRPSNLSEYYGCTPTPPLAVSADYTTLGNTNLALVLEASDDGLPDPPAAVTFRILSLPTGGVLRDNGVTITTVPHTLSGNVVLYDPHTYFQGADAFTFVASDGGEPPLGGDSNVATISIAVGTLRPIYAFSFDANPGWATTGQWAFGQPLGLGGGAYGNPDPSGGFTGPNVYGVNLGGNYSTAVGGPYNLTTPALDLSDASRTELRFRRWLNSDAAAYVKNRVEVSVTPGVWSPLWESTGPAMIATTWTEQVYNLSAIADHKPAVRLRWSYQVLGGAFPYSGWNIDDVEIWGLLPLTPAGCPGDLDCDGQVTFNDIDRFVEALGYVGGAGWPHDCPWENGDCNNDALVTFDDIDAFVALIGTDCP